MSDAALIGVQDQSHTAKVRSSISDPSQQENVHHDHQHKKHHAVDPTIQSQPVTVGADGQTSRITTDGNIIRSDDPSTRPDASLGKKLKGDLKGAINGTVGSIEAATGIVTRNHKLEQKGNDKMAAEDARLGAKHGVLPVGSNLRSEERGGDAAGTR